MRLLFSACLIYMHLYFSNSLVFVRKAQFSTQRHLLRVDAVVRCYVQAQTMMLLFFVSLMFASFSVLYEKLIYMRTERGINIYDCHFQKSNIVRILPDRISIHLIGIFCPFALRTICLYTYTLTHIKHTDTNLTINANGAHAKFTYVPKHFTISPNFIGKAGIGSAHALKLRFQRQNNTSLWPLLSNRFSVYEFFFRLVDTNFFVSEWFTIKMMEESVSGFICYIATKRGVFTHKFILTYVPAVLFCLLYLFSILNWPISSNASFTFAHILCAWPKTTKLYSFLKVCFECGDERILVDLFDIYFKVSLIFSTSMFLCIVQHLSSESLNMQRILIYLLRKWNILNSS